MTAATDALQSLYDAFAAGDGDALGRLIGDTHWVEASGGPYGGVYSGLGEVAENVFGPIGRDVRNFTAIPDDILPCRRRPRHRARLLPRRNRCRAA